MKREGMPVSRESVHWMIIGMVFIFGLMASCQSEVTQPAPRLTPQMTSTPSPLPSPTEMIITPEPSPTRPPVVQGQVSIWVDWTHQELTALYPHLETFQERFPDIQISVSYFPSDELLDRFRDAAEKGEEPTILIGPSAWTEQFIEDGFVRVIHGRVTEEFMDSILPVAWEGLKYNQSIFGLPFSMEGIVLFRNRDLISESPESLGDLVNLTKELEGEDQIGIRLDLGFLNTGAFLKACEGELLGADRELALTLKAGQCWLEIIQQWRLAGPVTLNTDKDLDNFEAGLAAWLVDGTWNSARIMEAIGVEQMAIDQWPTYSPTEIELTGYAWSRNIFFGVSSKDQDFDAAWILARFLLTPDVQADFAVSTFGKHTPVLKSVPSEVRWFQELMSAMATNIALPRFPEFSIFIEHLETAADDVGRRGYNPYFVIRWEHLNIEKALRYLRSGEE